MSKKLPITLALVMALCVPAYAVSTIDFIITPSTAGTIFRRHNV